MAKIVKHLKGQSTYNSNYYLLSERYMGYDTVHEEHDESGDVTTFEFGAFIDGKFEKLLNNHYIIIQHDLENGELFTKGLLTVEEMLQDHFSDHYFY